MEIMLGYGKANIIMYNNGSKKMVFCIKKASKKAFGQTFMPPSQFSKPLAFLSCPHTFGSTKYTYLISLTINMQIYLFVVFIPCRQAFIGKTRMFYTWLFFHFYNLDACPSIGVFLCNLKPFQSKSKTFLHPFVFTQMNYSFE